MIRNKIFIMAVALCLASCGTTRQVTGDSQKTQTQTTASESARKLTFVQKVSDNQLYQKNIVASMSFNVVAGSKDITLPGQLRMRKDEVVRLTLQMPLLGTEVGRLEFTPDYVLVVDRIHKEYTKAKYSDVGFLRDNGLSFYSLQSLFWNQLLLPGKQKVSESDLKRFDVNLSESGQTLPVSLQNNNMSYTWQADKTTGQIVKALITYASAQHGKSTLTWNYADFKTLGSKHFPNKQSFTFTTTATKKKQEATVTLQLNKITTDSNWDATTELSGKYSPMNVNDILGKLPNM